MTSQRLRASVPRARISTSALTANARDAVRRAGSRAVGDLRRDGWGHGLETVGRALAAAGASAVRVDPGQEPVAAALGLVATADPPTVDAELVLGLPGSGGVPVLSFAGRVLSTKPLRAGEGVSYGYIHRAPEDTVIALVSGGYAHGLVRALGSAAHVDVRGARRRIVGRVAMDVHVVDLGPEGAAAAGDEVVLFGSGAVRGELAEWERITGLGGAELAARIGLGSPREVVA